MRCPCCFEEYDGALEICPYCGHVIGEDASEAFVLSPGTEIAGRYVIGEMVGLGGFGITYKAWDKTFETVVAIKEYYPSGIVNRFPGNTNVIVVASKREYEFTYGKDRFLEEARNTAKFSTHKNIVNVYDFFEANNTAYIVMEFLKGKTLSQLLQQNNAPLPYQYCIEVAADICSALESIHKEHILHRDVSPDNIMVCDDGTVKLFDFGAARFSAGIENRVTVVVKPGFAPPEQYDKVNHQDPRTDIYALGATLYYAMTGRKPEESTNRKIDDELMEPSDICEDIPENVSTIIMRAMAVEPQYRFSSAKEFREALLSEKAVRSVKKERSRRKRNRLVSVCVAALLVVGAAGAFLFFIDQQRSATTLPNADLTLWYEETGNQEYDSAKQAALGAIIENFTNEYNNVTVTIDGVPKDQFSTRLSEVKGTEQAPDMIESTSLKANKEIVDAVWLTEERSKLSSDFYYSACSTGDTQYPTGITVPIIYCNSTVLTINTADTLEGLVGKCQEVGKQLVVSPNAASLYGSIWGDQVEPYVADSALEQFGQREAVVLLGDSSDYFEIQSLLPGEYTLLLPATDHAVYEYGTLWSILTKDSDAKISAKALLSYFTSDLAQDYFFLQEHTGSLPISRSTMTQYVSVYSELAGVPNYLSLPYLDTIADD